jgi:Zn-finger nucleic acid-binding protein
MRCKACDVILDDVETAKKDANGVHYDMCTECLTVSIATHWELENMESSSKPVRYNAKSIRRKIIG